MKSATEATEEIEAYSFKQLFAKKRKEYFDTNDFNEKEKIVNKFICDQKVSNDFLDILSKKKETVTLINTFEGYFNSLKYSLSVQQNSEHYTFLKNLSEKMMYKIEMKQFEYLSKNDPIDNFTKISECYSRIENTINETSDKKVEEIIDNIDKSINEIKKIYNLRLKEYYFPSNQAYPIYAYNYYSYKVFKILEKLQAVKKIHLFKTTNDKVQPSNISSKKRLYIQINSILNQFNPILKKFSYDNIEKDLIVLKILTLYLSIFEKSRKFYDIFGQVKEVTECLNSTPITSDILKKIEIFREGCDIPVKPEEWDSIGLNEYVYIKNFDMLKIRIKRFNNNILKYNIGELDAILASPKISDLNMEGLINYGLIKSNKEIEDYSISLLKKIFSSKIYINNFIKYDKRFSNKKEKMLEKIFNGSNKDEIFEELWKGIIFIPILKQRLSGFNNRPQYSIFINSEHIFNIDDPKLDKIIPRMHCEINAIYHEITHNISLLLAANLDEDNFESVIVTDDSDLNEIQKKYIDKYAQNSIEYKQFEDFGNLMEVVLFGIRPRIFRTFSSLFCLDLASYDKNEDDFRETCLILYQSQIKIEKKDFDNIINDIGADEKIKFNENNGKVMELIINLIKSKILKLLSESFLIGNSFQNESFVEDENARGMCDAFFSNAEYAIDINYCDKLD